MTNKHMTITATTPLTELIPMAQSKISCLESGEEFLVKDLFLGYEWGRIPKGIRTKLGSAFFAFAQNAGNKELEVLNKTPQNQQRYRKR
ncbi:MAG: single-stranded DNA-binding protein [Clostridiales bacterium]|jgi:hypothetical protein|nr:single-stranded DNA-binding protein [Clostridiales bacterium]